MSQSDPNVANGSGATVRTNLVNALKAAQSVNSSGTSFPSYAVYGSLCLRTDQPGGGVGTLYVYDGTSWIKLFQVNTTAHAALLDIGVTVGQIVSTATGAVASGTTPIPYDDTIPQNTEGDQYMSLAITPKSASSKLIIDVLAYFTNNGPAGNNLIGALFQDSVANALVASQAGFAGAQAPTQFRLRHVMTAGTTSSTTFKFRAGYQQGIPGVTGIVFNGSSPGGTRVFGGVSNSIMMIREVMP